MPKFSSLSIRYLRSSGTRSAKTDVCQITDLRRGGPLRGKRDNYFGTGYRTSATCLAWTVLTCLLLATQGLGQPTAVPNPLHLDSPAPSEARRIDPLYPEWWGTAPQPPTATPCRDPGKCVKCHEAQATMDPSHALPCVQCHRGDPTTEDEKLAHEELIANPGDLRHVDKTCGKCHGDVVRRVKLSPMALAPRMINHTRFAFGAQKEPTPVHGTVDAAPLTQIPSSSQSGNLGDDLLRRSCLRCHLHTRGSARWGEHRGLGCSACHVAYPNSADGRPRAHALVRSVGLTACLKCHNANHVGADFVGLFEKDFQRGFVSPIVKGRQPPRIYGAEQHRLATDVHFRRGMECMDCHSIDEVHGAGEAPRSAVPNVTITCEGCHVNGEHPALLKQPDGTMLLLRGAGRKVPNWNGELVPHRVDRHREKLKCSACHAAWSFQDFGLHLMLEERADYWKWAPTRGQNDPQVQELLEKFVGSEADLVPPAQGDRPAKPAKEWEPPATRDWLSSELWPGAWFRGYTVRQWEVPPLGLDSAGKVTILRPLYQYVISHVDAEDNLLKDREIPTTAAGFPALVVNPYAPHTTTRTGRPCHECHGNPKAAGLGEGFMGIKKPGLNPVWKPEDQIPGHSFRWDAFVDEVGKPLQFSTRPSAGPLDHGTLQQLMHPSPRQRSLWHEYLSQDRK